jgi:hypothetical protein
VRTLELPRDPRRRLALVALLALVAIPNLFMVALTISAFYLADVGYDWQIFVEAGRRVLEGGLYDWNGFYTYRYSPLLAYVFAAITPIGLIGWGAAHVVVLLAMPTRLLAVITVLLWPFWSDLYNGNTMTFVVVAAATALTGSRIGTGAFLAMAILMPRPLVLPLVTWIMWKRPEWRVPFLVGFALHSALVLALGFGPAWLTALSRATEGTAVADFGPAAFIGAWWLPIGLALAAVLTWWGRLGVASLAASPYWLPQYLLMLLLDLVSRENVRRLRDPGQPREAR